MESPTKAMTIRLPQEDYDQLVEHAETLGVAPAVAARMYLLRRIREISDPLEDAHASVQAPVSNSRSSRGSKRKRGK